MNATGQAYLRRIIDRTRWDLHAARTLALSYRADEIAERLAWAIDALDAAREKLEAYDAQAG